MPVVFLPLAVYNIIIDDLYIALSMYILNEALLSLDVVSMWYTLKVVIARVSVRDFFSGSLTSLRNWLVRIK